MKYAIISDVHANPAALEKVLADEEDVRAFRMKEGCQYLVNVGAVGYPRARPYSNYVLFDSESGEVLFREVDFDFRGYAEALKAKAISVPPWVEERI